MHIHLDIFKSMLTSITVYQNVQTSLYLCGECEYLADCVHDFNNHTHSSDDMDNEENSLFNCRFCDESCETLKQVMKHNKLSHTNNVQHCSNFLENICLYGDNCWFLHSDSEKLSEPSFKCKFCEKNFKTHNSLREHMKTSHIQLEAKCKNENKCKQAGAELCQAQSSLQLNLASYKLSSFQLG